MKSTMVKINRIYQYDGSARKVSVYHNGIYCGELSVGDSINIEVKPKDSIVVKMWPHKSNPFHFSEDFLEGNDSLYIAFHFQSFWMMFSPRALQIIESNKYESIKASLSPRMPPSTWFTWMLASSFSSGLFLLYLSIFVLGKCDPELTICVRDWSFLFGIGSFLGALTIWSMRRSGLSTVLLSKPIADAVCVGIIVLIGFKDLSASHYLLSIVLVVILIGVGIFGLLKTKPSITSNT